MVPLRSIHPRFYKTVAPASLSVSATKAGSHWHLYFSNLAFTTEPKAGWGFWDSVWENIDKRKKNR